MSPRSGPGASPPSASAAALRSLLEALPDNAAVLDPEGHVIAANQRWAAFARRHGGDPDGSTGATHLAACHDTSDAPSEVPLVASGLQAVSRGQHEDFQVTYPCSCESEPRWFRLDATALDEPAPRRVLVSHRDVTAELARDQENRRMSRSLTEAQRIARLGSWDWTITTGDLWWSDEVYRIFGLRPQQFAATYEAFLESIHPDDRARVEEAVGKAVEDPGAVYSIRHRIVLPDGSIRHVHEVGEVSRDHEGSPVRMIGTVLDVTDRVEAEQSLRDSRQAVEAALRRERASLEAERLANRQLVELEAMKSLFLSAVSHELRTPLTIVLGVADTLAQLPLADQSPAAELVDRLGRNARRLEGLLTDLLDINRLARGEMSPTLAAIDVAEVVSAQLDGMRPAGREIRLDAVTARVPADVAQVRRIVDNLVTNALRYSPATEPVDVTVALADDGVVISVLDRGPGIPDDYKRRVFEPFGRGDLVERHAPGTGVGLALVSAFAQLHGGSAWVEDRPGGGTAVRVLLPNAAGGPGADLADVRRVAAEVDG